MCIYCDCVIYPNDAADVAPYCVVAVPSYCKTLDSVNAFLERRQSLIPLIFVDTDRESELQALVLILVLLAQCPPESRNLEWFL